MPIYEYECGKCGEIFEVMQKISDPPPKKHTCGSKRIKRIMSRGSFILKGDGWYVTDYARKGKRDESSDSQKPSNSDGVSAKSESKTDSKSESKSDSKADSSKQSSKSAA